MRYLALLLLLLSSAALAQMTTATPYPMTTGSASGQWIAGNATTPTPHVPLNCPKYQHEQMTYGGCANTCTPDSFACTTECQYVAPTDECVNDIHSVTELEWQALMERLFLLEQANKESAFLHQTSHIINDSPVTWVRSGPDCKADQEEETDGDLYRCLKIDKSVLKLHKP